MVRFVPRPEGGYCFSVLTSLLRLAAALIFPATPDDPFSISPADYEQNLAVNVSGAYCALYQATRGFLILKK